MAAGGPGPAPFDPRGVGGAGACPQEPGLASAGEWGRGGGGEGTGRRGRASGSLTQFSAESAGGLDFELGRRAASLR